MPDHKLYSYTSSNPTHKKVLIFGGIHGNEICGPLAIERVNEKIKSGQLMLEAGMLTMVPNCNIKALQKNERYIERDLNRIFKKHKNPTSYEEHIANHLTSQIDAHDVLLDIHSTQTSCPPHVFVDYPTKENLSFAAALQPDFILFDWPKVYQNNPFSFPDWTTDRYAHEQGKQGLIIECGDHLNTSSVEVAENAIIQTLTHFELLAENSNNIPKHSSQAINIYMDCVYKKDSDKDSFVSDITHLQRMKQGQKIAIRETGEVVTAPHDGHVLFPKTYAKAGDEWFYFAHSK